MVQTHCRSAADWDTGPAMGQTLDQSSFSLGHFEGQLLGQMNICNTQRNN
jgi:hypothetical protein